MTISGENAASLSLFRKMGYDQCAHFRRVGEKLGRVIDVIFFQRSLEDFSSSAQQSNGLAVEQPNSRVV